MTDGFIACNEPECLRLWPMTVEAARRVIDLSERCEQCNLACVLAENVEGR